MYSVRIVWLVIVTGLIATTSEAFGGSSRIALIIGNGAYENVAPLTNPKSDANLIAAALKADGFSVTTAFDLNHDLLLKALRSFQEQADQADWAVVYYAGHGIEMSGTNYLIPVDAKLVQDRDVLDETVPLDRVLTAIAGARSLRMVILDACRNNPFLTSIKSTGTTRDIGRGLAAIEPEQASLVAYSAKAGSIAADGEGPNSPFATALAKYLVEPGVEVNKVFRLVRDEVLVATSRKQEPFVYGSLPGRDFYFRAPIAGTTSSDAAAPSIPESPGPLLQLRDDIAVWRRARLVDTPDAYSGYIAAFPNGRFNKQALEYKKAQTARKFEFADVLDAAKAVVVAVSEKKLHLHSIYLEYGKPACMSDPKVSSLYKGWAIAATLYYAFNGFLGTGKPEVKYPYQEAPSTAVSEINLRQAVTLLDDKGLISLIRLVLDGHIFSTEQVAYLLVFIDTLVKYRDHFEKQTKLEVMRYLDEESWNYEYGYYWTVFYNLGYSRADCLDEGVNIDGITAFGQSTYVTTAMEPWLYGFWYRRKIEGTDQLVLAALRFIRLALSDGEVSQIPPRAPSAVLTYSTEVSSFWSHNGSIMGLSKAGKNRVIVYLQPRAALADMGVKTDTVYFQGETLDGTEYHGKITPVAKGCSASKYKVAGTVRDGHRIILIGKGPILKQDCQTTGTRDIRLEFHFLGSATAMSLGDVLSARPASTIRE